MILARLNLTEEAWRLAGLLIAVLQPVLVVLLCAGFVLASAHLVAMLGTRWGKRRVSGKALAFSVVVHLCLVCAIVALLPEYAQQRRLRVQAEPLPPAEKPPEVDRVPIRATLEEPEPVRLARTGDPPVWEQLPELALPEPTRTPVEPPQPEAPPVERPPAPELASLPVPDLTPLPDPPPAAPQPAANAETIDLAPTSVPRAADALPDLPGEEAVTPSVARQRSPAQAHAPVLPEPVERPQADRVDRPAPALDRTRDLATWVAPVEEFADAQRASEDLEITRREGPAPSPLVAEPPGAATDEPGPSATPPPVSRERTVAPRTDDEPGAGRLRPATPPEVPAPTDDLPLSSALVRGGLAEPRIERPDLVRPNGDGPPDAARVPEAYRLRAPGQRDAAAREFGGSEESERAVEQALTWLAWNQHPDGYWDAAAHGAGNVRPGPGGRPVGPDGQDRGYAGRHANSGVTALALLAFLGAGNTLAEGPYADNVVRAVRWLVSQQRPDGAVTGGLRNGDSDFMYSHAMATFALAEAHVLNGANSAEDGEWLRRAVERGVAFTVASQLADGGWRYGKYDNDDAARFDGDMSIFGWQLMALKSAELGGVAIPAETRRGMIEFLRARSRGRAGGLAGYRASEQVTPSMTAEALFCKQVLGMSRSNPGGLEAVEYLQRHPPRRTTMNLYYWYYASLSLLQHGGEPWQQWNADMRDLLVQDQRTDGPLAGSWDPRDLWGVYGGRVYSTALAALCLEVYYRYLPLYRADELR